MKLSKLTARGSALSGVCLSCLAPWSAQAQQADTDTPVLEEVTVTAERRFQQFFDPENDLVYIRVVRQQRLLATEREQLPR